MVGSEEPSPLLEVVVPVGDTGDADLKKIVGIVLLFVDPDFFSYSRVIWTLNLYWRYLSLSPKCRFQ